MICSIAIIKTSKEINQTTYRQGTKPPQRENNCINRHSWYKPQVLSLPNYYRPVEATLQTKLQKKMQKITEQNINP